MTCHKGPTVEFFVPLIQPMPSLSYYGKSWHTTMNCPTMINIEHVFVNWSWFTWNMSYLTVISILWYTSVRPSDTYLILDITIPWLIMIYNDTMLFYSKPLQYHGISMVVRWALSWYDNAILVWCCCLLYGVWFVFQAWSLWPCSINSFTANSSSSKSVNLNH